jgi:hypothetical protein
MHTIKEFIVWMDRVRELDPTYENLVDFHRKNRRTSEVWKNATKLELELFMPPNPHITIQELENGMGTLYSKVNAQTFKNYATKLGHTIDKDFTQGGYLGVSQYIVEKNPLTMLFIGQKIENPLHRMGPTYVKYTGGSKRYNLSFDQGSIWVCGHPRTCHDVFQPFFEMVDKEKIPSAITNRWNSAWASNIPLDEWDVSLS